MRSTHDVPPSGRPPRRREETRRRLLNAALATFAERGFYGASVEEICDRAGYTRGAFYSNFATKEELFFALYEEQSNRLIAACEAAVEAAVEAMAGSDAGLDPCQGPVFGAALERFLNAQPPDRQWYLVNTEFTLHAVRHPEAARRLAEHGRALRSKISFLLTRALAEAGRAATIDPDAIVRGMLALHESAVEQRYLEPDDVSVDQLDREVVPALLKALSAPKSDPPPG